MAKLWGGRFAKDTDSLVEEFNSSISFDCRLYRQDILGSIAHAEMLSFCGIISDKDKEQIVNGLKKILFDIENGDFEFDPALEDVHMNIEKRLTEQIGQAGGRLHTARSRNDQVALDTHMYLKEEIAAIACLILGFEEAIIEKCEESPNIIMPGYTHLQRAQPILFSHHLLAYFFMLERDFERLSSVWKAADIMPLGAGALAGTTFPIDREFMADKLKFSRIYENSLDAVSDRDYILEFLSFASILMVHLSRLSEEIVLWCSSEFSFIELDDAHCTGSSMMPQKKNPDVPELVRGKSGRVFGNLTALLSVMKGLPLAYNKDLQEDKEGLFDTVDTIKACLKVYASLVKGIKVNRGKMSSSLEAGFLNATDMADYLVKKGVAFRKAHEATGKCVSYAIKNKKNLSELTLEEVRLFSPLFEPDILEAIKIENCVNNRNSLGGTSKEQVKQSLKAAKKIMNAQRRRLKMFSERPAIKLTPPESQNA